MILIMLFITLSTLVCVSSQAKVQAERGKAKRTPRHSLNVFLECRSSWNLKLVEANKSWLPISAYRDPLLSCTSLVKSVCSLPNFYCSYITTSKKLPDTLNWLPQVQTSNLHWVSVNSDSPPLSQSNTGSVSTNAPSYSTFRGTTGQVLGFRGGGI